MIFPSSTAWERHNSPMQAPRPVSGTIHMHAPVSLEVDTKVVALSPSLPGETYLISSLIYKESQKPTTAPPQLPPQQIPPQQLPPQQIAPPITTQTVPSVSSQPAYAPVPAASEENAEDRVFDALSGANHTNWMRLLNQRYTDFKVPQSITNPYQRTRL